MLLALGLFVYGSLTVQADPVTARSQSEIKAAYALNFTKFIAWKAPEIKERSLTLCITEDELMFELLAPFSGTLSQGRSLSVRNFEQMHDISACQVLYFSQSSIRSLDAILQTARMHSILTISDIPDFVYKGGIIGLRKQGNVIRFAVNLSEAKAAGLSVDSRLLELASEVIN